jgi:LAS superfamily LD-carboxypeptidase LdcB
MQGADAEAIVSILNTFQEMFPDLTPALLTFAELFEHVNETERAFITRLAGVEAIEEDLQHTYTAQDYAALPDAGGGPDILVHTEVMNAYEMMTAAMRADVEHIPRILSGFRSPAYQTLILIRHIYDNDFRLERALQMVHPPAKSEHCRYPHHAVDIGTMQAATDEKFELTQAYAWMLKNADQYGFTLSYPKKNQAGMIFEPWHWLFGMV